MNQAYGRLLALASIVLALAFAMRVPSGISVEAGQGVPTLCQATDWLETDPCATHVGVISLDRPPTPPTPKNNGKPPAPTATLAPVTTLMPSPTRTPTTTPTRTPTALPTASPTPKPPTVPPTATQSPPTPQPSSTPQPSTTPTPAPSIGTRSIVGQTNVVLDGVSISSTSGPCLVIRNSQTIEIRNSQIGPCGSNAIEISGSSHVKVVDSYIHSERRGNGCYPCDIGDGVYATLSSNLLLQGNVIAFGESNVELIGVTDTVVRGNFLLNPLGPYPRGQQVQVWSYGGTTSRNVLVERNFMLSSHSTAYAYPGDQQDAINFGGADGVVAQFNYVFGGSNPSGCGAVADHGANNARFTSNTLIETGQCGIGVGSGTNVTVEGNLIYGHGLNRTDVGNTALYVWQQYAAPCGPVGVVNNKAVLIRPDGTLSSYWKGPGCDVTTLTANTWDQAAIEELTPVDTKLAPPAVPPLPYSKPATSPWTGTMPVQ
jgi:hypothetical protein